MPQEIADVFLVVKLCADSHREALHRKQVLRLRHHDAQMIQFDEGANSPCELMKPFTASLSQSGLTCARIATRAAASRTFSTGRNHASTSWVDGRTAYARH